jgi:hypothetical protein
MRALHTLQFFDLYVCFSKKNSRVPKAEAARYLLACVASSQRRLQSKCREDARKYSYNCRYD